MTARVLKYYVLILAIACIGWGPATIYVKPGLSTYCSSCTGTPDADLCCEDGEGSNPVSGSPTVSLGSVLHCSDWAEIAKQTNDDIDDVSSPGALDCSEDDNYAIELTCDDPDCNVRIERDISATFVSFEGYIYLTREEIASSGYVCFNYTEQTGNSLLTAACIFEDGAGNANYGIRYRNSSNNVVETIIDGVDLALTTWYRIEWECDYDGSTACTVAITPQGGSRTSDTSGSNAYDATALDLGIGSASAHTAGTDLTIVMDNMKWDSDQAPGACSGWGS